MPPTTSTPTTATPHPPRRPAHGSELDDDLSQLDDGSGWFTICGFGSLLSERSARSTLPDLRNFRKARLLNGGGGGGGGCGCGGGDGEGGGGGNRPPPTFTYRRVFAHTADVFFERGIARPETREVASLSIEKVWAEEEEEEEGGGSCGACHPPPPPAVPLVVTAFEVPYTPENVRAFVAREHEFNFVAVHLDDGSVAAACERWTDDAYVARRFGGDRSAFWARWRDVIQRDGYGNGSVWHDPSVLPCRLYFRHCVLAARKLGEEDAFLDSTWLADRKTTARAWLQRMESESEEEGGGGFLESGGGGGGGYDRALLERYGG
jgi:hypothetical protein